MPSLEVSEESERVYQVPASAFEAALQWLLKKIEGSKASYNPTMEEVSHYIIARRYFPYLCQAIDEVALLCPGGGPTFMKKPYDPTETKRVI